MPKSKPKGSKRKREEVEPAPEPPIRRGSRQRRKKSYGQEFEEDWSPPKGTGGKETPQQPKATEAKPGPSTEQDPDAGADPPRNTVTYPSNEQHWKKLLPLNHGKRPSFLRKRLANVRRRL